MLVRDAVIKPLLRSVCFSKSVINCVGTLSKQPKKVPVGIHSCCVDSVFSHSLKSSNASLSRHFSDSVKKNDDGVIDVTKEWGIIEHDSDYEEFSQRVFRMKHMGHSVLVVQPYVRKSGRQEYITNPDLRLSEAIALVQSIPHWTVLSAVALSVNSLKSVSLFGSGNIAKIQSIIKRNGKISAVFVSVDILNVSQLVELQNHFELPVYDRYTIVIQIFRNHAVSKVAKLQVAMAEIPYLWQCLGGLPEGLEYRMSGDSDLIGGPNGPSMERRREMLKRREHRIRNELEKLSSHRQILRDGRTRSNVPSVAIVGYTNAGKTSLIQVLTREVSIQPRNRLFATLDVSNHRSQLPSGLELVYVDTVGFMSDLPDSLIQSFKATLEDAIFADLILHVWDVSHPECVLQIQHVNKILNGLQIERHVLDNIIVVGNKVDKMSESERQKLTERLPHVVQISCQAGDGIARLEELIESHLIKVTGRKNLVLKVRSGSPEHLWLLEHVTVTKSEADMDENFMLVDTLMTEGEIGKFRRQFIVKQKEKFVFE